MSAETKEKFNANVKPDDKKKGGIGTKVLDGPLKKDTRPKTNQEQGWGQSMAKPGDRRPVQQPVQQPVEQAAGFGEAMSSLLSTGGTPITKHRKPGRGFAQSTYTQGDIQGMTQDQAVEYGKQQWDKAPKEIRDKYANRVANRPADSERMAAFNQADQVAQAQANINSLPGADEDVVTDPEAGSQITNRTQRTPATPSSQTQGGPWKKSMDKPTKGAGHGY